MTAPTVTVNVEPRPDCQWRITSEIDLSDREASGITFIAEPAQVLLGAHLEVVDPSGVRIGRVATAAYSERVFGPGYVTVGIDLR